MYGCAVTSNGLVLSADGHGRSGGDLANFFALALARVCHVARDMSSAPFVVELKSPAPSEVMMKQPKPMMSMRRTSQ